MSAFKFRLDRVLHLRSSLEEQRGRELQTALREVDARRDAAAQAAAHEDHIAGQMDRMRTSKVSAGLTVALAEVLLAAVARTNAATHAVGAAETVAEGQRARYTAARVDRRALEQLRENAQVAWKLDASRAEQRELDEYVLLRRIPKASRSLL